MYEMSIYYTPGQKIWLEFQLNDTLEYCAVDFQMFD